MCGASEEVFYLAPAPTTSSGPLHPQATYLLSEVSVPIQSLRSLKEPWSTPGRGSHSGRRHSFPMKLGEGKRLRFTQLGVWLPFFLNTKQHRHNYCFCQGCTATSNTKMSVWVGGRGWKRRRGREAMSKNPSLDSTEPGLCRCAHVDMLPFQCFLSL